MEIRQFTSYGVVNFFYFYNKGDKLGWHDHKIQGYGHGHYVIQGKTLYEEEGKEPRIITPKEGNIETSWKEKHQITALEDGTIFVNPMARPKNPYLDPKFQEEVTVSLDPNCTDVVNYVLMDCGRIGHLMKCGQTIIK